MKHALVVVSIFYRHIENSDAAQKTRDLNKDRNSDSTNTLKRYRRK